MHAIIEFLPVIFGFYIAQFFRLTKSFRLKNVLFIIITVLSGIIVNRLNAEGAELLIADIPMTAASTYIFILLSRLFAKIRI